HPASRIVTAAGVSSGIDMALWLAARIAGDDVARAIQLGIEYDPQPPFDPGSPQKAGPDPGALVPGLSIQRPAPANAPGSPRQPPFWPRNRGPCPSNPRPERVRVSTAVG